MTWDGVWSHKVDGVQLNDLVTFITQVPEVENGFEQTVIMAPRDGDYPAFIRLQPTEGRITFLIAVKGAHTAALWHDRVATLKSIFTPGMHVYSTQVRGMPAIVGFRFVFPGGLMLDYSHRLASASCVVPKPVLAPL